ncbi:MAG: Stk1 family PASTA domain-containing Ser/Thr kinase [Actinomycetota bacterium]
MQTATADPLVGRVLEGRYRIQNRIARGGMSTVYRAVDERLDRFVAIKVMSGALSADPAFADRFTREARAAARLGHMNAVSVYDQGSDADHVFLVMELVSGRTLRDLLRERGRLSPAEAVSIMEPVLGALAAAHRAGLVHRDIKPENILLSDEGVVKVADFGLARAVEADVSSTRTGLMMGTVAYCSPEQISRGDTDQRSDVYSAGVLLFELLTGEAPFVGGSAMAVAYQHVHSRVPAPSSRVRGIPEPIDDLIVRATDSDPAERPADAAELLAELHDVRMALGLPVVAVPPRTRPNGTSPVAAGYGRPDPFSRTAVTTDRIGASSRTHDTVAAPFAADLPSAISGPPPGRAPVNPLRARRRRRALIMLVVFLLVGAASVYAGWWFASGRYSHVPDVAGEPRTTALSALRKAGLSNVTVQSEYSETVQKDAAIRTQPGGGARALPDTKVTLVVSLGKERFTVPDVRSTSEAAARAALARIPVQLVVTTAADDAIPKGKVVGTDPQKGSQVKRGQVVTIVVSSGPPIVTVPDVTGKKQDVAAKILSDAKFAVTIRQEFSLDAPAGTVVSQDPSANSSAAKFSTVTLVVSKGSPLVTIPTISTSTSAEDAQAQLEALGLKVKISREFGAPFDRFVGSDPPAGSQVPVGSRVTIYIV